MKLIETNTTENYDIQRFVTEGWELGLRQMFTGVRFNANPLGEDTYTLEYCAGSNPLFLQVMIATMTRLFELLPRFNNLATITAGTSRHISD